MSGLGSSGGTDASGLGAGMSVIAGLMLGAAVGATLGYLIDRLAAGIMIGGSIGLVLGFYLLYVRYFKTR